VRSSRWTPIAGWCAATATSIVLASVALLPVLRPATPDDRALSSIDQLPAAVTSLPVPLLPAPSTTAPASAAPAGSTPTTTPARTRTTKPAARRTHTPPPAPAEPSTPPATTTEDGWTVTAEDDGSRTYVRSFQVQGGQAVIRMTSAGTVALVTATPADGYAVQKVQDTPGNLAVYFNQTAHSFIIHAVWQDTHPFVEVSEVGR
jgi:hypothetical protein